MRQPPRQSAGWILYDDSCGICRRWVPFWGKTLQRRGFEIAPLQAGWVREKLGMDESELLQDLRLLLAGGELISGADTYRYAMKRIWWALPLYWFSVAPVGRRVFDFCYRKFADNRLKASAACGLANRPVK
jgi:predicted DCC family thiol-disulfide oxidoreductase YuxK